MSMNNDAHPKLDSSRSNSAFISYNIDQIDFNYLFDNHLDYDDIVQCFIFNNSSRSVGKFYANFKI